MKTQDDIKDLSPELCEVYGIGQDDEENSLADGWPEYFEVDDVPKLMKAELKAKPKMKNFTSVGNLLQEYNIRDQLDRKMSEFHSEQANSPQKRRNASEPPVDMNM